MRHLQRHFFKKIKTTYVSGFVSVPRSRSRSELGQTQPRRQPSLLQHQWHESQAFTATFSAAVFISISLMHAHRFHHFHPLLVLRLHNEETSFVQGEAENAAKLQKEEKKFYCRRGDKKEKWQTRPDCCVSPFLSIRSK